MNQRYRQPWEQDTEDRLKKNKKSNIRQLKWFFFCFQKGTRRVTHILIVMSGKSPVGDRGKKKLHKREKDPLPLEKWKFFNGQSVRNEL